MWSTSWAATRPRPIPPPTEVPDRILLLATTPRLPAGLLSWAGWAAVRSAPVYAADPDGPTALALRAAGVDVTGLDIANPRPAAHALRAAAGGGRDVVWLAGPGGDPEFVRTLGTLVAAERGAVELEVVYASWDPPGARLLDVVAVMDRLRSPGGCPWDAAQSHDSLRRYLLEETYEAYDALVDGDLDALREELGDVLLQVVFHARLATEADAGSGTEAWGIDDVAAGLVDKLVRRHPHVFADLRVSGAGEVEANWEQIKRAEKGRTSVTEGLARSQPALALAQALVRRAARHGLPIPPAAGSPATATDAGAGPGDRPGLGDRLLAMVAAAEATGLDAEAELRAAGDRYAERLRAAERAAERLRLAEHALGGQGAGPGGSRVGEGAGGERAVGEGAVAPDQVGSDQVGSEPYIAGNQNSTPTAITVDRTNPAGPLPSM